MANMRYRKPSVKTVLGVTKLKKRVKKALGINAVLAPFRAVNNYQRRMLRRAGYYNPEMKALRAAKKGQIAGPIGALQVSDGEKGSGGLGENALMMAAMMSQGDHDKGEGVNPLLMGAMLAGEALGSEGKGHHKKGGDGPGLAEAMLLATAMKGSEEKHETKAKSTRRAKRAATKEDEPEAHHRAAHASQSKAKKEEEEPKRKKGFRLFG
jgi:hypothetical protein